ncbi:MAG: hypothetical protein BWZ07_03130 [Alphaproteobacteria bacterium ADurb.BinA280]|nr:MAG: hypothetical protein BWZ07_03130 [Alphaproteobacteria bacterium ADurb.BinA280]
MREADSAFDQQLHNAFEHDAFLLSRQTLAFSDARQHQFRRHQRGLFDRRHPYASLRACLSGHQNQRTGVAFDLGEFQHQFALTVGSTGINDDTLP